MSRLTSPPLLALAAALVACGAAPEAPRAPTTPVPMAVVAPAPAPPPPDAPASLALWVHVESPSRFASFVEAVTGPPAKDASCTSGNITACFGLFDADRPMDVGVTLDGDAHGEAVAFTVESAAAFKTRAQQAFEVTETKPGIVRLNAADLDKDTPILCDVGAAEASRRMVCGTERGIEQLGPWLRTSPRPATTTELVRAEIYRGPALALSKKELTRGSKAELQAFARDFDGAVVTFNADSAPATPMTLDIAVKLRGGALWSKALLAPTAAGGSVPDTFGRLSQNATTAIYLPGGGPVVAVLDLFESSLHSDAAKAKGVEARVREILGRPAICAQAIDFDGARAAMAKAHKAPQKELTKARADVEAALGGYLLCGFEEPIATAEKLARDSIDVAPKTPDKTEAVRPATGLDLPKGSFVIEATHVVAGKKGPPTKEIEALFVADGATTWVVGGDDAHLAARLVKHVLAQPKGPVAGIEVPAGTVASGYVSSRVGAFTSFMGPLSLDEIDAGLASGVPGLLRVAFVRRDDGGPGGTLSLRLSSDVATAKKLGERAAPLRIMMGALAFSFSIFSPDGIK